MNFRELIRGYCFESDDDDYGLDYEYGLMLEEDACSVLDSIGSDVGYIIDMIDSGDDLGDIRELLEGLLIRLY